MGYTPAATVYAALFTAVTDAEAGTGTEVSGNGYTRVAVTFSASSGGAITTSGNTDFPTDVTANWGTITHASIFDASTAGNSLTAITALASSVVINVGDIFRFPTGDVDITLD